MSPGPVWFDFTGHGTGFDPLVGREAKSNCRHSRPPHNCGLAAEAEGFGAPLSGVWQRDIAFPRRKVDSSVNS